MQVDDTLKTYNSKKKKSVCLKYCSCGFFHDNYIESGPCPTSANEGTYWPSDIILTVAIALPQVLFNF